MTISSLPARRIELALALLSLTMAWACSSPSRHALPEEHVDAAFPVGMPGVRHWGDELSPEFQAALLDSSRREFELLARQGIETPPRADFLALSGGGANGAFGAGLLCGWTAAGDRPQFRLVTGISTGALIAPFAFVGPECDALLRKFYTTTSTEDVLDMGGPFRILFGESAGDSAPLAKLLAGLVDEKFLARVAEEHEKGRLLFVATTNLDALRPVIWDMGKIAASGRPEALALFRAAMLASASIPGVFPPVMVEVEVEPGGERYDEMHVDGGASAQVFVYPEAVSIRKLAEERGVERDRRVFIVRNSKLHPDWSAVERDTFAITGRAIGQLIRTQGVGDLYRIYAESVRDEVEYNLAYIPDEFDVTPEEEFDPAYMSALFDLGERMARAGYPWLERPPGLAAVEAEHPDREPHARQRPETMRRPRAKRDPLRGTAN